MVKYKSHNRGMNAAVGLFSVIANIMSSIRDAIMFWSLQKATQSNLMIIYVDNVQSSAVYYFPYYLLHFPDLEEKRLKLFPSTTGALWTRHSGCPAASKNSPCCIMMKSIQDSCFFCLHTGAWNHIKVFWLRHYLVLYIVHHKICFRSNLDTAASIES